jgi:hypothetical protein
MTNLTDHERDLITRAREVGPALRSGSTDRERLAGWLLAELADLAERTAGTLPKPSCPGCGTPYDDIRWTGGNPPYGPDNWKCTKCGHQWTTDPARTRS